MSPEAGYFGMILKVYLIFKTDGDSTRMTATYAYHDPYNLPRHIPTAQRTTTINYRPIPPLPIQYTNPISQIPLLFTSQQKATPSTDILHAVTEIAGTSHKSLLHTEEILDSDFPPSHHQRSPRYKGKGPSRSDSKLRKLHILHISHHPVND